MSLEFERLDFKLYPPASIVKQVKLKQLTKKESGIQYVEANQVGIYFNVWDFFSNKITVDKIRVYDAEVVIDSVGNFEDPKNRKKINIEELMMSLLSYDEIRAWIDRNLKIKIDQIQLENTFLIIEDKDFEINNLSLTLFENMIGFERVIRGYKPSVEVFRRY